MTKGMSCPCREEDAEGPAKLKLSVLAGQLIAMREGLGKVLSPHLLSLEPVESQCLNANAKKRS